MLLSCVLRRLHPICASSAVAELDSWVVSAAVRQAVEFGKPVVALESTVITHGLPRPLNLNTAVRLEDVVQQSGALPATVGVIDGKFITGLNKEDLKRLAYADNALKVSRRDISMAISQKLLGGTTVSATLVAAAKACIPIFATGGLGGAHRGAEATWDISADLYQLAASQVCVVCCGVKSLLDIGKSLEILETLGVPVVTFGESSAFPGFYTPESGFRSPFHLRNAAEVAAFLDVHFSTNLGGVLIAVPVEEKYRETGEQVQKRVSEAISEATASGVSGSRLTPFVLERINQLTNGKSLEINVALIENNARVAAEIASRLSDIQQSRRSKTTSKASSVCFDRSYSSQSPAAAFSAAKVFVIGGSMLDVTLAPDSPVSKNGASHPGQLSISAGGVGRNIADALCRLGTNATLLSAKAADASGALLSTLCSHMTCNWLLAKLSRTGVYCAQLDSKRELQFGICDAEIHEQISAELITDHEAAVVSAQLVVADGNLPIQALNSLDRLCALHRISVWFEPTDVHKATKMFSSGQWPASVKFLSPNWNEFVRIANQLQLPVKLEENPMCLVESNCAVFAAILRHLEVMILTLGNRGLLCFENIEGAVTVYFYESPLKSTASLISPSGAGDCFNAGFIHRRLQGLAVADCASLGLQCALLSLQSSSAVPDSIDRQLPTQVDICRPAFSMTL